MREGDYVTLDASAGVVYAGEVAMPMVPPAHDINYQTVLNWADKYKRMMVLANADSVEEATKAFALGADGMNSSHTKSHTVLYVLCQISHDGSVVAYVGVSV